MSADREEGLQRRELDDIHEMMCQLGFFVGRLLGPTDAFEYTIETLFQWTINFESWILDKLYTSPQDFDLKEGLLLLMRLNIWRLYNWSAVSEQEFGGLENIRRQDPPQDATP